VAEPITWATKDSPNYFGQNMSKNGESWSKTTIAGKIWERQKFFRKKTIAGKS
jgi:hypothetical protein